MACGCLRVPKAETKRGVHEQSLPVSLAAAWWPPSRLLGMTASASGQHSNKVAMSAKLLKRLMLLEEACGLLRG